MKENIKVAKYMGYSEGFPHKTDEYGYHQCESGFHIQEHVNPEAHMEDNSPHEFLYSQLKYDSCWSWLMPVFHKLNDDYFANGLKIPEQTEEDIFHFMRYGSVGQCFSNIIDAIDYLLENKVTDYSFHLEIMKEHRLEK